MVLEYFKGGIIKGLSSDTKPTNVPEGTIFVELNTLRIYLWVSSVWEELVYATPAGSTDLKAQVLESSTPIGAGIGRKINFSVASDFDVTEDTGNDEYDIKIADNAISNAHVNAAAAIDYSKLALTGAILNADLAGSIAYSKLSLTGTIVNADISASAAIASSKLAAKEGSSTQSGDGTTTTFTIAHGFGSSPTVVFVDNGSNDTIGSRWLTKDATNITINYVVAPPSGASNLTWYWRAA